MGPLPAQQLITVPSEALAPGMFVAELDRSWLHTPFPATGFLISSPAQLEQLRHLCRYVYVDPALSDSADTDPRGGSQARTTRVPQPASAAATLAAVLQGVAGVVRGARRQGIVDLERVAECSRRLVAQLLHDADALHWCLRVDAHGSFLYRRAAGTATVATTLALRLGCDLDTLLAVASGGLLLDIGKIAVPVPILAKPGALGAIEQHYVRRHVERGVELVAGHDVAERTLEMIAGHHERVDGSGYPLRLQGTHIPLFGRLAAIADAFDAMTLDRRYAAALSPYVALRRIEDLRDRDFDAALVAELGQALGPWPVGTVVELASGEIGVVCRLRPAQPLHPRVILTHDRERTTLATPRLVPEDGPGIRRALAPNHVALDPQRLLPVCAAAR